MGLTPDSVTVERLRLLVLASRPSDYTEMSELARALAARGHTLTLLYFYAPGDPGSDATRAAIDALRDQPGLTAHAVNVDDIYSGKVVAGPGEQPLFGQPSQATEIGLYNTVLALRDRVLGQERARALRRHLPTVRRIFPVIYKVARLVDVIRNIPAGLRLSFRAASELEAGKQWPWLTRLTLLWSGPKVIADAALMEGVYRRFLAFFRHIVSSERVDALLLPEDIVGNLWPVAVKAGHDANIPAVVLPYTLANREEAFQSLKDQPPYQTARNRIAAFCHPEWRLVERGADLVRLPSSHIFAHHRLGIAPPDPWMMNSGFADAICVDSQASFDYFRAGRIPAEQMRVVGSVSQDRMFQLRRSREARLDDLRAQLQLAGRKPVLLVSGCPDQLSSAVPFCEFASMGDVATHVGRSLAPLAEHYHLVVRPHPNFPEFGPWLEPFGFVATMMPTAALVPLADLFVAFASATIRWAIACGIPAVNYDVFHYGYGEFAQAKAVRTVRAGDAFRDLVQSLTPGAAQMREWAAGAGVDRDYWSLMDGGGVARIESAISEARRCYPARRSA